MVLLFRIIRNRTTGNDCPKIKGGNIAQTVECLGIGQPLKSLNNYNREKSFSLLFTVKERYLRKFNDGDFLNMLLFGEIHDGRNVLTKGVFVVHFHIENLNILNNILKLNEINPGFYQKYFAENNPGNNSKIFDYLVRENAGETETRLSEIYFNDDFKQYIGLNNLIERTLIFNINDIPEKFKYLIRSLRLIKFEILENYKDNKARINKNMAKFKRKEREIKNALKNKQNLKNFEDLEVFTVTNIAFPILENETNNRSALNSYAYINETNENIANLYKLLILPDNIGINLNITAVPSDSLNVSESVRNLWQNIVFKNSGQNLRIYNNAFYMSENIIHPFMLMGSVCPYDKADIFPNSLAGFQTILKNMT